MGTKKIKLDDDVLDVLNRSKIGETTLDLPEQLDPKMYAKMKKIIQACGGTWNRGQGTHIFTKDPREALGMALENGHIVDVKKSLGQFFTPDDVADQVIALADIRLGNEILEPSAGDGALLRAIVRSRAAKIAIPGTPCDHHIHAVAIEIDEQFWGKLTDSTLAMWVTAKTGVDFLTITPESLQYGRFDRIVANPPYDRTLDITHIQHMRTFLNPGGRLVAIVPNGPKQQEVLKPLASDWIDLPDGSFKESGTNVKTAIVVIDN